MNQEWSIQTRGEACSATGIAFAAGEVFHTLLYYDKEGLRREDLCQAALAARPEDAPKPFSQWRSKFEPPPAKPPEPLGKQSAEQLLRAYMEDPDPKLCNVRYILAVMLERKRTIKEVETTRAEDGTLMRVYQFPKTGEVLVIPDPQLRLSQMAEIQLEVASLLGAPAAPSATAPEGATQVATPESAPTPENVTASETHSEAESDQAIPQPSPDQNAPHAPDSPREPVDSAETEASETQNTDAASPAEV